MLRIGVIGVGRWGKNHVRVLKQLEYEGKVKLEAICDVKEDLVLAIKNEFKVPIAKTDYREMLKHVDAVIISTSISELFKVAEGVLIEGKHALIEKPVATSVYDAMKLLEIVHSNKLVAAPGMIMRFDPTVNKLREILLNEAITYIIFKRLSRRPEHMLSYPVLLDLAVHDIDLCRYITSNEIAEVIDSKKIKLPYDEIVLAVLRTTNNIYCILHVDGFSPYKIREIDVITPKLFVRADTSKGKILYYDTSNAKVQAQENVIQVEYYEPLKKELEWFIEVVKTRPATYAPSLYDAVENLKVVEAIQSKIS